MGWNVESGFFKNYGKNTERFFARKNNVAKYIASPGHLHMSYKLTIRNYRLYLVRFKFELLLVQQMNINKGACQAIKSLRDFIKRGCAAVK
jgi:hypothetical protein